MKDFNIIINSCKKVLEIKEIENIKLTDGNFINVFSLTYLFIDELFFNT